MTMKFKTKELLEKILISIFEKFNQIISVIENTKDLKKSLQGTRICI